ncbi:uncharacterized protein [Miscanthus floridulus]|uniref:uncharacterized protein isoform X2 n=1 Tax=Miscanthus floridulus TaxID=154761 RepID=UPI00345A5D4E
MVSVVLTDFSILLRDFCVILARVSVIHGGVLLYGSDGERAPLPRPASPPASCSESSGVGEMKVTVERTELDCGICSLPLKPPIFKSGTPRQMGVPARAVPLPGPPLELRWHHDGPEASHISAIISSSCVNLAKNLIEVWDLKKKSFHHLDALVVVLNYVRRRHIVGTQVPFKAVEMEKYLKQPAGNNECGFYVMWAMLRYIDGKSEEADKLHKKYNHERLLDMEIVALQSELAKFILAEVLEEDGVFFIAQSVKFKDQYGPERLARLF